MIFFPKKSKILMEESERVESPVQEGDQGESVIQNIDPLPRIKSEFVINLPGWFLLGGSVGGIIQRVLLLESADKRSQAADSNSESERGETLTWKISGCVLRGRSLCAGMMRR